MTFAEVFAYSMPVAVLGLCVLAAWLGGYLHHGRQD
jgi:hypothetical protein